VTPGAAPTADTTPPTAPSFVNAVGVAGYKIKITWGESFDPIVSGQLRSALMGYQVQRDGLALCNVILDFGETLECFDDGLPMGTAYYYTVVAFDYAGNRSPVAGPVQARTLGPTEGPPFPPQVPGVLVGSYFTGLAASCPAGAMCAQPGGIPLTWTQVSIVTRYQIEQSFVDYTTNPPGATPFVVIGETTGLAFTVPESQRGGYGETYRVRSCSNTGCGFYSQEASFVLPITFPDPGGTPF
jgi:hypothetical protein